MISVEYSKKQKCLHVDDLQKVLKINREKFFTNEENDWEIIGIFKTMEEAELFAKAMWNNVLIPRYYKKNEVF